MFLKWIRSRSPTRARISGPVNLPTFATASYGSRSGLRQPRV
jgi:hypothetical protein